MPLYNIDQDVQVGGSNSCRNEIRSRGTNSDGDEPLVIVKKTRQLKVTMSSMNSHATPHIQTMFGTHLVHYSSFYFCFTEM